MKRVCKKIMAVMLAAAVVFGAAGINQITTKADNPRQNAAPNGVSMTINWDDLKTFVKAHQDMKWKDVAVDNCAMLENSSKTAPFLSISGVNQAYKPMLGLMNIDNYPTYYYYSGDVPYNYNAGDEICLYVEIWLADEESYCFDPGESNNYVTINTENVVDIIYPEGSGIGVFIDLGTLEEFLKDEPKEDPEPKPCQHDYVWFTEGEKEILRCKNCGLIAIDAMNHMNLKNTEKVEVEMVWNSLPARVVTEIADAEKDTTFHYYHKGYEVTIKVPAGKIIMVPGVDWYGPEFLADLYREYTTVKNWRGPVDIDVLFTKKDA